MTEVAAARPLEPALLRRVPLLAAAFVSVLTVIVLLVWLVLASLVVGGVGLAFAARASTAPTADRAAKLVSTGFGFAVGPAVYMLVAAFAAVAS